MIGCKKGSSIDSSSNYSNRRGSFMMSARIEIGNKATKEEDIIPKRKYMQRRDAVMILNNIPNRMQTYK